MTLIEVSIVMSVLVVSLLAFMQSINASMKLTETNRESALAMDALREMVEVLQGVEDFATVFTTYVDAPGFEVDGLAPVDADPDGLVGEIVFPTVAGELREHVEFEALGMPRDLTGDGEIDFDDHSGDYRLLPVLVRVRWKGTGGERTAEISTLLADR